MKKNTKALLLSVCAVVIAIASMVGTIAYLTDSESVKNTFTVGRVGLDLDEAKVNPDGTVDEDAGRVRENKYHLLPGHTYTKDPTIHVDADSEDCYVFVKVENGIAEIEGDTTIADQMKILGWVKVEGLNNVYVFAKEGDKYVLSAGANVVVFNNFTIKGEVDNDTLAKYKDAKIVVTAYAVQKDGFENNTPAEIWKATFGN